MQKVWSSIKHHCTVCGEVFPASEMVYGPDPYAENELGRIEDFGWRCEKCYRTAMARG